MNFICHLAVWFKDYQEWNNYSSHLAVWFKDYQKWNNFSCHLAVFLTSEKVWNKLQLSFGCVVDGLLRIIINFIVILLCDWRIIRNEVTSVVIWLCAWQLKKCVINFSCQLVLLPTAVKEWSKPHLPLLWFGCVVESWSGMKPVSVVVWLCGWKQVRKKQTSLAIWLCAWEQVGNKTNFSCRLAL